LLQIKQGYYFFRSVLTPVKKPINRRISELVLLSAKKFRKSSDSPSHTGASNGGEDVGENGRDKSAPGFKC
jgi:hypothetical protein